MSKERNCDACVYSTRSGGCNAWTCNGNVTKKDFKNQSIKEFADWLVKYKVVGEGAMEELIRDFKGETGC